MTSPFPDTQRHPPGRVPKHDLEAEAAVISALMLEPEDAWRDIEPVLRAEDFYSPANRRVFEAIGALMAIGEPVDAVTIAGWLKDRGRLVEIGGVPYLARITDAAPAVANRIAYADAVSRAARQRQAVNLAQKIAGEGYGDVGDLDTWVGEAAKSFDQIATGGAAVVDYEWVGDTLRRVERERLQAVQEGRQPQRIPTGIDALDRRLTMRPKELIVVGAIPSMGKTALVGQIMNHVVNMDAWQPEERMAFPGEVPGVMMIALEMSRESLAQRILCGGAQISKKGYQTMALSTEEHTRVAATAQVLSGAPLAIVERPSLTVADVTRNLRAFGRELGQTRFPARPGEPPGRVRMLIIDYLTLLKFNQRKGATKSEIVGEATMELKNLAKSEDIVVVVVSQLSREVVRRPGDKRPLMSDLRDSGEIEQAADSILFVHRDEVINPQTPWKGFGEVIIAKQREGEIGRVVLRWRGDQSRFVDLTPEDAELVERIKAEQVSRRKDK